MVQTDEVLSRSLIKGFLVNAPSAWSEHFDTLVVDASLEAELRVSYDPHERTLGIHCPKGWSGSTATALDQLAISLLAIEEFGGIPDRISSSKLKEFWEKWTHIKEIAAT